MSNKIIHNHTIFNKYITNSGVGGTSISVRRAKYRRSSKPINYTKINYSFNLEYYIYNGYFGGTTNNPNIQWFNPEEKLIFNNGRTNNLYNLNTATNNNYSNYLNRIISIHITGYFKIPQTGSYTFYTTSNETSFLYINNNLVVNNGGPHTSQTIYGSYNMIKDVYYKLDIYAGQKSNNLELNSGYYYNINYTYNIYNGYYDGLISWFNTAPLLLTGTNTNNFNFTNISTIANDQFDTITSNSMKVSCVFKPNKNGIYRFFTSTTDNSTTMETLNYTLYNGYFDITDPSLNSAEVLAIGNTNDLSSLETASNNTVKPVSTYIEAMNDNWNMPSYSYLPGVVSGTCSITTRTNNYIRLTMVNSNDPTITLLGSRPTINTTQFKYIHLRYRVISGIINTFQLFYYNSTVGQTQERSFIINFGNTQLNIWKNIFIDTTSSPFWNTNWTSGNWNRYRIDPVTSNTGTVIMDFEYFVISNSPNPPEHNKSLKISGYFKAKKQGTYNFFTSSNNNSVLIVNNQTLINNSGRQNVFGNINMTLGNYYPFTLYYGNTYPIYPPNALTSNNTSLSGLSYGNGTYITSASSESSISNYAFNAFNYVNDSGCWRSFGTYNPNSTVSTITTQGNILGEWLQIQLPYPIFLDKFSMVPNTTGTTPTILTPKEIKILGSNNPTEPWNVIYSESNINLTNSINFFTVNANASYIYYRVVVISIQATSGFPLQTELREWSLYETKYLSCGYLEPNADGTLNNSTNVNDFIINGTGLGTYYYTNLLTQTKYKNILEIDSNTIIENNNNETLFSNLNMIYNKYYYLNLYYGNPYSTNFPPSSMTAQTTTINNNGYITLSSSNMIYNQSWKVFNYNTSITDSWSSGPVYNSTTGIFDINSVNANFIGGLTITTQGNILGEWLQIELPRTIILDRFKLSSGSGGIPNTIKIVGNNNTSDNWVILFETTNINANILKDEGNGNNIFEVNEIITINPSISTPYKNYRLIIQSIKSGTGTSVQIREWTLYNSLSLSFGYLEPNNDGSNSNSTNTNDFTKTITNSPINIFEG